MSWLKYSVTAIAALAGGLCLVAIMNLRTEAPTSTIRAPRQADAVSTGEICIGGPLALHTCAPQLRLPDLTADLFSGGVNGRPDATADALYLQLSNGENRSVAPNEKCHLSFDGEYHFSEDETTLWCLPGLSEQVVVALQKEDGELLQESLTLKPVSQPKKNWLLGNMRVDNSLLPRMKARWHGEDLFLTQHGGEEYSHVAGKQRIDFGEGAAKYSVFVGLSDALIYDKSRWQVADGPTEGFPLLQVKRVDQRMINFELWDVGGRQHLSLSLARARDPWLPAGQFQLIAVKTHTRFVVDMDGERMEAGPNDWLLLGETGWQKLDRAEEIDSYVERKRIGELLVIDRLRKEGGKRLLDGHLFNKSRTDVKLVEVGQ